MTLKQQINRLLDGAANSGVFPAKVESPLQDGAVVSLSLSAADALACLADEVAVSSPRLASADGARLRAVGELLASRLNYLLEPIRLVETDSQAGAAQLRSSPPHQDEEGAAYYELFVRRGGSVSLVRYTRPHGAVRTRTPAQLTREVLCRLVGDFQAAIG